MVSWDQAKGNTSTGNQRREVERLSMQIGDTKVRLIGEVLPRYVYWVTTNEGKKMPVECLRYSRVTETFDDSVPDPLKEVDEAIFGDKPEFAYICNIIDRSDGKIKVFDLRATIYRQIVDYATNPEYLTLSLSDNEELPISFKQKIFETDVDKVAFGSDENAIYFANIKSIKMPEEGENTSNINLIGDLKTAFGSEIIKTKEISFNDELINGLLSQYK